MQFIEALQLRSKLVVLFVFISLGLISIGVVGSVQIEGMKKHIDSLYFGSLVPVEELNKIIQTYQNGLSNPIHKAARHEVDSAQLRENITHALTLIDTTWKSYASHYKSDDEMNYVAYTKDQIIATNNYFRLILNALAHNKDLAYLNLAQLEGKTEHITTVIKRLIHYEVSVAQFERKKFLDDYEHTFWQLCISLVLILLGVLLVSYYVFQSIQKDQTQLEQTTKKLRRANKKLENASYTDALTGLYNRRYFNLVFHREVQRAKREKNYITFMMIDIDFFKQYNDTYGHIEGDNTLKSVTKILKDTLKRPSDFVFRLGGEEFGVLLSGTDETNSAQIAHALNDAVREAKIVHQTSTANDFVTISIGVVCCVADNSLKEDTLLSRADEMLYKAKESGRDRYIMSSDLSETTIQKSA